MTNTYRGTLTAAPFGIATAAYVGIFVAHYDRLPGQIATHFSGGGDADGFMSRPTALWSASGLLIGLGLLFTVLTTAARDSSGSRLTAAIGVGTAVTLGYPLILTVLVNSDVQDPADVRLPMWHVAVLLFSGVSAGALAWWTVGAGQRPEPTPPALSLRLAEGETAAWSRTSVFRPMLFVASAVAVTGLSAVAFASWWAGLPLLVLSLSCFAFSAVRVTVDRRGLAVTSTVLPRPRLTLPLGDIRGAGSIQVNAVGDFGGWGYRIRPNRRGVVLRSGEALSVRHTGGREYVVTVDDSTTAAALLNGLVDRHAGERD
jgi:hypothetical protein